MKDNLKLNIFSYFVGDGYNHIKNIDDWCKNINEYYCPEQQKQLIVVTDNEIVNNLKNIHDNLIVKKVPSINDKNIRLLFKFNYIDLCIKRVLNKDDIFVFFQSNLRCNKKISFDEIYDERYKITVTSHYSQDINNISFSDLYSNTLNSITYIKENININKYFQACHFICDYNNIKSITEWIINSIQYDKTNNIFTRWHDETYFNYYINFIKDIKNVKIISGKQYACPLNDRYKEYKDQAIVLALNKDALFKELTNISETDYVFNNCK